MTQVLHEGFDDGLYASRWVRTNLSAPAASAYNRVGNVQAFSSSSRSMYRSLPAADQHATITVGMHVLVTGFKPSHSTWPDALLALYGDGGTIEHVTFRVTLTGQIAVFRGANLLATTDIIWESVTGPRYVEMQTTLHDTNGAVKIWSDGVVVLDLSGIDTKNGGVGSVIDRIGSYTSISSSVVTSREIDDIYVTNGAGASPNNGNLGDVVIDTLKPNGNGAHSDFVGSDGNSIDNHLLVDEANPDGDATYVESTADTDRDSYGFEDLVYATGVVVGVIATAACRNLGGADNIEMTTRIGVSDYDGATQAVPAGYDASVQEVWEKSPASASPWTIAEVNAAEFGVDNVA